MQLPMTHSTEIGLLEVGTYRLIDALPEGNGYVGRLMASGIERSQANETSFAPLPI